MATFGGQVLGNNELGVNDIVSSSFNRMENANPVLVPSLQYHQGGDSQSKSLTSSRIEAYEKVKEWVNSCLDQYQHDMKQMLYPLFIYCYFDLINASPTHAKGFFEQHVGEYLSTHGAEIESIRHLDRSHMQGNEVFQKYKSLRVKVSLSTYSYELFLSFVKENELSMVNSIIANHFQITTYSGSRPQFEPTVSFPVVEGEKKKVYWGAIVQPELLDALEDLGEDIDDDDDEAAASQPSSSSTPGIQDAKRVKRRGSKKRLGADAPHAPPKPIELPPPRGFELTQKLEALREIRARIKASTEALPSICMYTFFNATGRVNSLTVSEDLKMASAGCADSSLRLYSLTDEGLCSMYSSETIPTISLNENKNISDLLDPSTKTPMRRMIGHSGPVYGTSFSPDSMFLLSCSEDSTVRLWSTLTYSNVVCYRGHSYPVWDCSFNPWGYYFATASHDRTARLWSTENIYPLRVFAGHISDVECVRFHPNGNYLATGGADTSCRLWDVQTGEALRVFEGHSTGVRTLAFSKNGKYIATGADDGMIMLWDIAETKRIAVLRGHTSSVYSLSFSGEDSLLMSGGSDSSVRIWDVKTCFEAANTNSSQVVDAYRVYPTKSTPVYHVSFSRKNVGVALGVFDKE